MTVQKPLPANPPKLSIKDIPDHRPAKGPSYVKGSHAARVRAEQDERRVELLALHDVLSAQRDGLNDQLEDINEALRLLSEDAPVPKTDRSPIEMAA